MSQRAPRTEPACSAPRGVYAELQVVQRFLEAIRVGSFGFGESLEPIGNFTEALVARALRHPRVHIRVFVRFAGNCRLEIQRSRADRQSRGRVADRLEVLQMPMGMAGFAFGSGTEHRGHVIESFDIRLGCEVQITPIRLRFACKCILQILFRLATFQIHGSLLPIGNSESMWKFCSGEVSPPAFAKSNWRSLSGR